MPATLDGSTWIVGDIRVDGQSELIASLRRCGSGVPPDATDAELVLHAYRAWGESCVDHLLGDFAFALWDARLRKLFCARDQMGVRPFYYARLRAQFVFSNAIDCLRQYDDISGDLDELAIADFLLFECNLDPGSTTFASIKRIPPAHTLTIAHDRWQVRRYWTLPVDEPVYYRWSSDYVDRFHELLATSVRDRLPTDHVAVFMSGGLDSSTLAAEARAQLPNADGVTAFTYVHDRLIPDEERGYASLVAERLQIPIRFWIVGDEYSEPADFRPAVRCPEPVAEPFSYERDVERHREMAARARIALYGEGPDNVLHYEWSPYLRYLAAKRRWGRMLMDVGRHVLVHRRVPLLPTVPAMIRWRQYVKQWQIPFPGWLNSDFVHRHDLRARWDDWNAGGPLVHPVRPAGYRSMQNPIWPRMFERLDAGRTRSPLDVRFPYLDLRLMRFLLALPALPWCRNKFLLRRWGKGVLPPATLARPKTTLRVYPGFAQTKGVVAHVSAKRAALLEPFVDSTHVRASSTYSEFEYTIAKRPSDLGWWLEFGAGSGGGA